MASATTCGLILLGNSGVGKSFLANRLLDDDEAFESKFSARSVTRHTEWKNMSTFIGKHIYSVANIPGLVEANQKLIDENRTEIMKAFEQCPFATVLFVFGHKNGRIPDEDLVAFMKINEAYEFPSTSLALIVNGIPSDRLEDYKEKTAQLLQELTHIDKGRIYFIEKVSSEESKKNIHGVLVEAVAKCQPIYHQKKHDIELLAEEISRLKTESKQRQEQLLAQEYEYNTKRQQVNVIRELRQEYNRPSQPLQTAHAHTPVNKTSTDSNRRLQDSTEIIPSRNELHQSHTENLLHNPDRDNVIQLAQQLEDASKETSDWIRQIQPPPPSVIIVYEKESDGALKIIKKGYTSIKDHFKNVLNGSHSHDLQHPSTPQNANEYNSYVHNNADLNHPALDPRRSKPPKRRSTKD
ncbi:unnamed protein product [Adineta steineri]|uniref:AIG1-type G domain-containing protein n=1 Tax=Adineta steineri TaxID=433720 RepID=A0A813MFH4_9BILA|nr:unnamed protein product [Adineta steineri]CAF3948165.1 unnamed protein product [Adineta steineri]